MQSSLGHWLSETVFSMYTISDVYRLGHWSMSQVYIWKDMRNLKKIQSRHSSSHDPLIYYCRKIYFDIFLKPESEYFDGSSKSTMQAIRKKGYIIFDYKELSEKLNKYAEEEEYDTRKSNKLWPHDSQQLANRIREVSVVISRNDNFAIEVRRGKNNSNEYIIGTKDAVEKCIESQENDQNQVASVSDVQSSVQLNTSGEAPFLQLPKNDVPRSIDQGPQKLEIENVDLSRGIQLNT